MHRSVCIFVLLLLLVASAVNISGCKPQSLVSRSQEIEVGREAAQQVERQYRVTRDPALQARVNTIGQSLVQYSGRTDITYTFKVLDINEVNAFSLPGGWIYINKGLVDFTAGNTDQLAGVIAHEIAHVARRHHAAMMGRQLQAQILVGTLTRGQVQQLAGLFANLTLLKYSRQQEYESDRLGISMMYRSRQYDPQGEINFFQRLLTEVERGREPSRFQQAFNTHPVTSERIKRAQDYLSDLRAGRATQ